MEQRIVYLRKSVTNYVYDEAIGEFIPDTTQAYYYYEDGVSVGEVEYYKDSKGNWLYYIYDTDGSKVGYGGTYDRSTDTFTADGSEKHYNTENILTYEKKADGGEYYYYLDGTIKYCKDIEGNWAKYEYDVGKVRGGLELDGVNDYVEVANSAILQLTNVLTIELAINTYAGGKNFGLLSHYDNHGEWNYQVYMNSTGHICFNIGSDDSWERTLTSNAVVNDGKDYHVTATYDKSYMRIYIGGVEDNYVSETRTMGTGDCPSYIGTCTYDDTYTLCYDNVNSTFEGAIYSARIYNRALTADEISSNYEGEISTTGLVLEHDYRTGTAADLSGNNNHGTVYNGAACIEPVEGIPAVAYGGIYDALADTFTPDGSEKHYNTEGDLILFIEADGTRHEYTYAKDEGGNITQSTEDVYDANNVYLCLLKEKCYQLCI
jgi:YD repeat-containing protein